MAHRPPLAEFGLNTGRKTRLYRILHERDESLRLVSAPRDILAKYPST